MVKEYSSKLIFTYDDQKPLSNRFTAQVIHDRAIGNPEGTGGGCSGDNVISALCGAMEAINAQYEGEIGKSYSAKNALSNNSFQDTTLQAGNINGKIPLGLSSHAVWLELRLQEIEQAIQRYLELDKDIPAEWVREHQYLGKRIAGLNATTPLKPFPAQS